MTQDRPSFARELLVATQAAEAAAALLTERRGEQRVRLKGHADLVTDTDEAAQRLIIQRIQRTFPDDGIVAEEGDDSHTEEGRRWIIDPIDGTTNYVHGHPFACVSIGLVDEAGPAVGVIHAPFLGEAYYAVRGKGAFCNEDSIRVSGIGDAPGALLATGFPFKRGKGDADEYLRLVADALRTTHGVRRAGSAALDLAYVAAGRVEGFFEIGLSPWDMAAGMLLVTEAGGRVGGWPGDAEDPLRSGRLIASNGRLHRWMEELVGRHVPPL